MLCTECDWEREGDTIIMAKHCCEFGMPECGKFKLRGTDPGRWIPVTERLQEKVGEYLVLSKAGNYSIQWFYIDKSYKAFLYVENGTITHWMPLPEPPKEDSNG